MLEFLDSIHVCALSFCFKYLSSVFVECPDLGMIVHRSELAERLL